MAASTIFYCTYCPHSTSVFLEHLLHRDHHRHLNVKFNCGFNKCKSVLNCERVLRLHILRQHNVKVSHFRPRPSFIQCDSNAFGKFVCNVSTCKKECDTHKQLIKHLKSHLHKQQAVSCPHDLCTKVYRNLSSFSSHLTRIHRGLQATVNVRPRLNVGCVEIEKIGLEEIFQDSFHDLDCDDLVGNGIVDSYPPVPQDDYILQNLAMFCMKLEFKFIVPEKVVQYAMEEIFKIHQQSQHFMKQELEKNMKMANISPTQIDSIIKKSFSNDPFMKNFQAKLSTTHRRKKLFKETLPFVEPQKVEYFKRRKKAAGVFENVKTFFYYVSVKETLKACFSDKSLNLELQKVSPRSDGVLADVTDGKLFKENMFFNENPLAIRLSLYQDGVEIVNPLGAAKTIHKVIAVYLSILNLPDCLRSHTNTVKLVALCKEKLFDHDAVYGKIVKDLKELETVGINVPGIGNVKAGLLFIAGDNVGSHALGGFLQSFSKTVYFCRYCLLDRPTFVRPGGELHVFPLRTVDSYNLAVEKGKTKKYGFQGVRRNSVFNELETFHVCNPGRSPLLLWP